MVIILTPSLFQGYKSYVLLIIYKFIHAIHCFALLLSCQSLDMCTMIFKYIYTVFISSYESSDVDFARSKLQELIQERSQTRSDNERILFKTTQFDQSSNEFNQQDQKKEQDFEDEEERFKRQYSHSVKENLPFTVHFLDTQESINNKYTFSNVNTLANQSFTELLQKEFMPYIFLGFVLRDQEFEKPTTHMVDSSVEAWFRT